MENTRSPNLNRLGAVYGLLWGAVALVILKAIGFSGDQFLQMTGWYLLGSIPTGILVTRLLAGRLGRTKAWKVWTYGPAALLLQQKSRLRLVETAGNGLQGNIAHGLV